MKESQTGRGLHRKAVEAVEHQEDFLSALNLINQAQEAYISDKDYLGASEVQGYRSLVYKHLKRGTGDRAYLILAMEAASSAVELAKLTGSKSALALPYRDLGQAYAELGNFAHAAEAFENSLEIFEQNPPERHDRDSVRAEVKGHLAHALYKNDDSDRALALFDEAIKTLEGEERSYEVDVWLSGIHMRLAEALAGEDREKASEHLGKAKEIIDSNPDLKLRKKQWEALSEKLAS